MRVHPRDVELVIVHKPGCLCVCDLTTPDPDAALVQLGCVTSYLVSRVTLRDEETEREMTDRLMRP